MSVIENTGIITVYNKSPQMIPLTICPPGGDFFLHRQSIYLKPNKETQLPASYAHADQLNNLQKSGHIVVRHNE